MRECCVCFDEVLLGDGLDCGGGGDETKEKEQHFTCQAAFLYT